MQKRLAQCAVPRQVDDGVVGVHAAVDAHLVTRHATAPIAIVKDAYIIRLMVELGVVRVERAGWG
jgi:hypothetical protein